MYYCYKYLNIFTVKSYFQGVFIVDLTILLSNRLPNFRRLKFGFEEALKSKKLNYLLS